MFKKFSFSAAIWALILICLTSFSLMLWASRTDSAIMDELAHIPAGYDYVHNFDYRLNPEHPPLVKTLAMLPVLFLNPTFPTGSNAWLHQVNAQWDMGTQFLYQSGNDATAIVRAARIMPILLTILTITLIYAFAAWLMGPWWALLPAFLFALSPTILAHGHYVTTDIGAAFGILLALYFFARFTESPSRKSLWFAGIAFGIAQLMKFSTPLLVPLFIFLYLVLWIRDISIHLKYKSSDSRDTQTPIFEMGASTKSRHAIWHAGWNYLKNLTFIFVIGYVCVVYPVYFIFTANYPAARQVSDTTTILNSFSAGPTPAGQFCHSTRCLADLDIWMAGNPILHPFAEYLLGILMVIQRADGGNKIYFLGNVVGSGGWIYFPLLYLLKEPVPALAVVLIALVLGLWWMTLGAFHARRRMFRNILDYANVNFAKFAMGSFIVLYWAYSMHSTLNIGIRHIIPTLPLIYILATGIWKKWILQFNFAPARSIMDAAKAMTRSIVASVIKYCLLIIMLIWLVVETLFAAPYFLSYFNEFGGGTMNGYHYVTDSNYDWGQDLLRLQTWVNDYNNCAETACDPAHGISCPARCEQFKNTSIQHGSPIAKIAVDYFGGGSPKYYLGAKEIDWSSSKGNPASQGIHWFAVSVNTLESAIQPLAGGQTRNASDTYAWLTLIRPAAPSASLGAIPGMGNVPPPDFRIGTSIFVYHL